MKVRLPIAVTIVAFLVACAGDTEFPAAQTNNTDYRSQDREPTAPTMDGGAGEDVDMAGCPDDACSPGEAFCEGAGVRRCIMNPDQPECGMWDELMDCDGPGEICAEGRCTIPGNCVDIDGDGYGTQCDLGPDCDENDTEIHSGAVETCDDIDNNCDGGIDEGFGIGMPCMAGDGACEASGFYACAADGTAVCRTQPTGEPEVCDGVDNDCDGVVDNGVCNGCQLDPFEPNNSMSEAELLRVNEPKYGLLCPADTDFFELETKAGTQYKLFVTYPTALSHITVNGFVDGSMMVSDRAAISVNGTDTADFHIEVAERDGVETLYRIVLVDALLCAEEDGFVPNQTIDSPALLPPFWTAQAYICPGPGVNGLSDFFTLGEVSAGEVVDVTVEGLDVLWTDLDLYLWADPDGDGTFEIISESVTDTDFETLSHTAAQDGELIIEVYDYDGYGGNYDVGWTVN